MTESKGKFDSKIALFSYITGFLTALIIFILVFFVFGHHIGFNTLYDAFGKNDPNGKDKVKKGTYHDILFLPDHIIKEIKEIDGVIENAYNPTNARQHDTILVKPDKKFSFVLKPNIDLIAYQLKSIGELNIDPPVLYLQSNKVLSTDLKKYLNQQTRVKYHLSTNTNGLRMTQPVVSSERKILIVGDSVAFGVGVNDNSTIASYLQNMLKPDFQVINAAVGGYNGEQSYLVAKQNCETEQYEALVYVACQNDFMMKRDVPYSRTAEEILLKFATLKEYFSNRIVIVLVTYMEYNLDDILGRWHKRLMLGTNDLRLKMSELTDKLGLEYIDWSGIVQKEMEISGSIFSRFALYADHAHLSPSGNKLLAKNLYNVLGR